MTKRIIICCDGTWSTADQRHPTNIIKFARAILPSGVDGNPQVVFYDPGVGTESGWWDRIRGGALGKGLNKNIEDAYRFLALNFEGGDEIFLMGFSRGAYTVRSLAGLVRNCGLLRKVHLDKFQEAFALYQRRDAGPKSPEATRFKEAYSPEVGIKFIGVWDTVGALGVPVSWFRFRNKKRYEFHDVELSSRVEFGYQALSIDEQRKAFEPAVWKIEKPPEPNSQPEEDGELDEIINKEPVVEQVWFAGVHTDVGGGSVQSGLSDIAFTWLKQKATDCGITFDNGYVERIIRPNPLGEKHDSMKWYYKPFGKLIRLIGGRFEEAVHPAVLERRDAEESDYRPENLVTYLADPRHKLADA